MKISCILNFSFFTIIPFGYSQSLELKIQKFDIHDCSSLDSLQSNQDLLYEYERKCNHFYIEWPTVYGESDWVNPRIEQKLQQYICGLIQSDQIDTVEYTSKLTDEFVLKHNRDASAEWNISCEYYGSFKNVHQFSISHGGYYYGAAHGFGYSRYFHFNNITGKEMGLEQLFEPNDLALLTSFTFTKLKTEMSHEWDESLSDDFFLTENFLLSDEGISFFYDAYEIGPYAMGYPEINITWSEIKTCLSRQ
jgi:hypothetical protein